MSAHARLTALPAALRNAGYKEEVHYWKLREQAIEARFPAFQINGQWKFNLADLHAIAAALGMVG